MSKWIWYPGDYEIFHNIQLHSRRQEFGADYPCFWSLANVYPRVNFYKTAEFAADGWIILRARESGYLLVDGRRFPSDVRVPVAAGRHSFEAVVIHTHGLPAIFIESDQLLSDESWECSPGTATPDAYAACDPAYTSPDDDVERFPFVYTPAAPVSAEDGLYDFGKEMFGLVTFDADPSDEITVSYGESLEEASDPERAILKETVSGRSHYSLRARAFRYLKISGQVQNLTAVTEMLDVKAKASFSCGDPLIARIFDTAAYTFHLNSREFLLDGIKRDRWCWSGDAYQSYLVNDYLFADRSLNRRTITALFGKPPYLEHVNTINDYSALLIIGTWEYYFTTGDEEFIRFIWPRISALYEFIVSRLDGEGFVVKRPGDWIFIDWHSFDKDGPLCAEQILLWQTHRVMAKFADLLGIEDIYSGRAARLKERIEARYWDQHQSAYIDSFTSGKKQVTRHAAIFSILYDFVDPSRAKALADRVLENEQIPAITTPYFELYELMALGKLGRIEAVQDKIASYWGGMLALGATTIWEEFDPEKSGAEHYAMYGKPYGKSLCHAWGSGPILLLGRYVAGVTPTDIGSRRFTVSPNPGRYESFRACVPIADGTVTVEYENNTLRVTTDVPGGTVRFAGCEEALIPGKEWIFDWKGSMK